MALTSFWFLVFVLGILILYYLVPKKMQWWILLAGSMVFYLCADVRSIIFILITATSVYFGARLMQKISDDQKARFAEGGLSREEKSSLKERNNRRRKAIMICVLLLNVGILCAFKYLHFALEQFNRIASAFGGNGITDTFQWIVPLGISFYTFQSIGYLVDVYWKKIDAEKNYGKMLLFVSFFPQITQGPISDFTQLSGELFGEHTFSYQNYAWGAQRMLWGFAKKILLADMLSPYVSEVFQYYYYYTTFTLVICGFFYSVQIYADFSGYMDIVCGLCQILGIRLSENFERPYFSKSVAEYWRRWHITLGAWFKTYIYYPIAVSKWNKKLGKLARTKISKRAGMNLPATVALVAVWLTTGLWHGASWGYIAWGGVNGMFIIVSLWLEPFYETCKKKMRINESAWLWRAFQTLRTFALVTVIKVLPEVGTLRQGLEYWKCAFTRPVILRNFVDYFPYPNLLDMESFQKAETLGIIAVGTILLFAVDLLQRKKPVREYFNRLPGIVRVVLMASLIAAIILFGNFGQGGGFMYAQF